MTRRYGSPAHFVHGQWIQWGETRGTVGVRQGHQLIPSPHHTHQMTYMCNAKTPTHSKASRSCKHHSFRAMSLLLEPLILILVLLVQNDQWSGTNTRKLFAHLRSQDFVAGKCPANDTPNICARETIVKLNFTYISLVWLKGDRSVICNVCSDTVRFSNKMFILNILYLVFDTSTNMYL